MSWELTYRSMCGALRANPILILVCFVAALCAWKNDCIASESGCDGRMNHAWLLIYDSSDDVSEKIANNICAVASYAAVGVTKVDLRDAPRLDEQAMAGFTAVLLASEKVVNYVYGPDLLTYVEKGGLLGIMMRGWAFDWMPEIGIHCGEELYENGVGFRSNGSVYEDIPLVLDEKSFGSSFLKIEPDSSWESKIEYLNPPGVPLLLTRCFGKGKILFWNCSSLHEKTLRGIMLFSIARELPIAAVSIFNTTLFQIDDSPPPAYGFNSSEICRELGLSDAAFYLQEWYPKILGLLHDYGIKPSHFLCMNYRGKIMAPFPETTDRQEFFDESLEVIASWGNEVGLHGYNHQALTTVWRQYKVPWPSEGNMVKALESARSIWYTMYLPPCLMYVPSDNIITVVGKRALRKGFPEVRGICRIYNEVVHSATLSPADVGAEGDEFGPDPQVPGLMNIPRFSSGMSKDPVRKMEILNGIMAHGMINHFIHPDDMMDPARVEKDWVSTREGFRQLLAWFQKLLPCSERIYSSKFLSRLKSYCQSNSSTSMDSNGNIQIRSPGMARRFWFLFSRNRVIAWRMSGAKTLCELETGHLWIIELTAPVADIQPLSP